VIGASIVIECILAMEEYHRACKLGAVVKESTIYMPQSVNQMTAFIRVQKAVSGEQHDRIQPHLPFVLYLCSCKFLHYCLISCTVVSLLCSHLSLLLSVFLSIHHFSYTEVKLYLSCIILHAQYCHSPFVFSGSLSDMAPPLRVYVYLSLISVTQLL